MLRLPPHETAFPTSIADAVALRVSAGAAGAYVAGGTDLYPNMKRRQQEPRRVIDIRRIPELNRLEVGADGTLLIGSGVTLTRFLRDARVRTRWPVLAHAASEISTPMLQNMGTVGGNLLLDTRCNYYDQGFEWRKAINFCMKKDGDTCWVAPSSPRCWAVQSSDLAPVVVALDARVVLAGPDGERTVPAAALYHDDGMAFLTKRPEELLVRIEVPAMAAARASYRKLRRRGAFDFPVLGVAAWAAFDGAGKVAAARIVLGAVGSHPKLIVDAGAALVGGTLDDDQLDGAARIAGKLAKPLDNTDFTIGWRKDMAPVFVRRALEELRQP
ncbi:MAG TPA: FAD binding domain-containing protein [Gemmatimonadales bacterium]|nr:FAD binding domain-containing protein [Gemmatimonadales bacterium]